jgi:putative membrane protein
VWATTITLITKYKRNLGIKNLLLTVLGFVVALALSFRSSTGYERYIEGRKYWAQLTLASRNIARLVWIHIGEREGDLGKEDLLAKLTALNLVVAFSYAVKHTVRFEPYADYDDIKSLIGHIDTWAGIAKKGVDMPEEKEHRWKVLGMYLGLSFAEDNPRKAIKQAQRPLGHLPLEILNYLSAYLEAVIANGTLKTVSMQNQAMGLLTSMSEVLMGVERIVSTPLPIAYSIAISQITWVYILILPFQLVTELGWNTIPGSIAAAYIIFGLAAIGREVENPFGDDPNDLALDSFCLQIAAEVDVITSMPPAKLDIFGTSKNNLVLHPLSQGGYDEWKERSVDEIREALRKKVESGPRASALRRAETK